MTKENRIVTILAFLAFILLIAAYANHFENGFHFDDFHAVVNNLYIRDLHNIPSFFVDPKMFSADPSHWGLRSLVTTSLAVDYWLGGNLDPFWFQMSTFVWHILLCVVIFFLYKRLLKNSFENNWAAYFAIAATSWYALNTANAETLNYIISRSDVLSTFMIVFSLFIYINWPAKRKYLLYIIPAILGVFAKETVLVLVILMFFYILLFEKKLSIGDLFLRKNLTTIWRVILQILPLAIVVIAVQVYTLTRISSIPGISNPLLPYVLTQTFVWVHYFISFFLPVNLSADSDWTVLSNHFDERIIVGCVFIVLLIIVIIKASTKKETRPIAFGLIWFAAALLPTSLAPFAEVTNDHRMYFPFIGLALAVVCYLGLLIRKYEHVFQCKYYHTILIAVLAVILCANAYGITQRNKVWLNEETLWRDVVTKSPTNGRGLMNYGVAEDSKGNYVIAEALFKKALIYSPTYNLLYINLAVADAQLHKNEDADKNFRAAILYGPDDFNSYISYAQFLNVNGKTQQAHVMADEAMKLNAYSEQILTTVMTIDNELELWDPQEKAARQLLAISPKNSNAQIALNSAQKHIPIIVNGVTFQLPVTVTDYINLSVIYYNIGLYARSIDVCNTVLNMQPNNALAYCNIGAAYLKLQQWDKSIDATKKSLELDPSNNIAKNNLVAAEKRSVN